MKRLPVCAMPAGTNERKDRRAGHYTRTLQKKAAAVAQKLKDMKPPRAAEMVTEGIHETFGYYGFPCEHWRKIRTNNPLERIMKEIRRRTRVVGSFPDGKSALMLVAARLKAHSGDEVGNEPVYEDGPV